MAQQLVVDHQANIDRECHEPEKGAGRGSALDICSDWRHSCLGKGICHFRSVQPEVEAVGVIGSKPSEGESAMVVSADSSLRWSTELE